ncbi:solute carrier family 22 member 13-like [Panulirus ornatus]|uniref:solute carrier family 22 member 13-like n=1 Tax=Panulirus ornatus TaxID=150431 RepID=UPI003A84AD81
MESTEKDRRKAPTEETGNERQTGGGRTDHSENVDNKEESIKSEGGGEAALTNVESVDGAENIATFENLLQLVGTSGRWNYLILIACSICTFTSVLQMMSYQFLGATPDHWCHVTPLVEANWTEEQILSFAIPYNNDTGKHETCQMYEYDYSLVADLGYEEAVASGLMPESDNASVVACYSRDFNLTQYQSTVSIEWDLVCERRALYPTTQSAVQVGRLIGAIISSYLLDRFGRRPVVLWSSLLVVVLTFATSASSSVEVYIILKLVTNVVYGGLSSGNFLILMEICSAKERSKFGTLFMLPWALGYMALPGIAYLVKRWRWLQATLSLPTLLLTLQYWFMPESPRWLILQGRYSQTLEILRWGAKVNRRSLPSDQYLLTAMEKMSLTVGLPSLASHYVDPYIYIFFGGLMEVPSYLLLWPAIVFLGKVGTMSFLFLFSAISILLLTYILYLPEAPILAKIFLSLSGKMSITSANHLIKIFAVELFPTKYRSMAISQAKVFAKLGSICSPYIIDILGDVLVWVPSAVLGISSLVAAGLSCLLPETTGRNIQEDEAPRQVNTTVTHETDSRATVATEAFSPMDTSSVNNKSPDGQSNTAYEPDTETSRKSRF